MSDDDPAAASGATSDGTGGAVVDGKRSCPGCGRPKSAKAVWCADCGWSAEGGGPASHVAAGRVLCPRCGVGVIPNALGYHLMNRHNLKGAELDEELHATAAARTTPAAAPRAAGRADPRLSLIQQELRTIRLIVAWWFALTLVGAIVWALVINHAIANLDQTRF